MTPSLTVTQRRSSNGCNRRQLDTLRSLGLRRIGHTIEISDNAQARGMVHAVRHIVEVTKPPANAAKAAKQPVAKAAKQPAAKAADRAAAKTADKPAAEATDRAAAKAADQAEAKSEDKPAAKATTKPAKATTKPAKDKPAVKKKAPAKAPEGDGGSA
jgi:large subunit ribosomal protein L30